MNKVLREIRNYLGLPIRGIPRKVPGGRTLKLNLEIQQDSISFERKMSLNSKQKK